MLLTVAKRSKETTNGNFILTLVGEDQIIKTALGNKTKRNKYLCAVVADSNAPEQGAELDIDLTQFTITARKSQLVDDSTGEITEITNKWLTL